MSASRINLSDSGVWFFGVSVHFSSVSQVHHRIVEWHIGHQLLPDASPLGVFYLLVDEAGLGVETHDLSSTFLNPRMTHPAVHLRGEEAPVDGDDCPVNIAGEIAGQHEGHEGYLIGLPRPPEGQPLLELQA